MGIEWALGDPREHPIDFTEGPLGKADALRLVPGRGILEIGLGEWPNDEPARHFRSVAVVEFLT